MSDPVPATEKKGKGRPKGSKAVPKDWTKPGAPSSHGMKTRGK